MNIIRQKHHGVQGIMYLARARNFFSKRWANVIKGSAEALPILCVRYIRWERERYREREREREREKDGSDVTIVALKLAMSFALLLAKNVHLSIDEEFCAIPCQKICQFLPSWRALSSHFPLPKTLHFSKQFAFFALQLSNGAIDRGSKQQSKRWNFRLHSSFSSKYRKNSFWVLIMSRLTQKARLARSSHFSLMSQNGNEY